MEIDWRYVERYVERLEIWREFEDMCASSTCTG